MGFLAHLATVAPVMQANAKEYTQAFWSGDALPGNWIGALSAAGIEVTPDLSMTLSAMYSGVSMIATDLATLPLQTFKLRDDGGKDRIRGGAFAVGTGGINDVAYKLRWAPNDWQTSTEYLMGMFAQLLLRNIAYAEIVQGPNGFLGQLLPRHPDRVRQERLPSGRLRYRLSEASGQPRYLTQDEMHVIRDLSLDGGRTPAARVVYGANALGTALAAERAAAKFFKSGMTAGVIATYKGGRMEEEEEKALHGSLSRYAAGVENSFGLLLVPDDITIDNLGVEPDKAQMMLAREWTVREVARQLRMPGAKLGIKDSVSYNSQVQAALDYIVSCLRTYAVMAEQAIQRDLILAKDAYIVEFKLEALLRGDFETQANYLEKFLQNRLMWPSEGRLILNMNPDPELDELWMRDHQPGQSRGAATASSPVPATSASSGRSQVKGLLAVHGNAVRCLRRERRNVETLAKKHANDPDGWKAALRDFYHDHAAFVAETMRIPAPIARGFVGQHGSELEARGIVVQTDDWERCEADELAMLALGDHAMAA